MTKQKIDRAIKDYNNWVIAEGYGNNTDDSLPQIIDPSQVQFIGLGELPHYGTGIKLNIHNHVTWLINDELLF